MFRSLLLSLTCSSISFAGTLEQTGNLLLAAQTLATPGYEWSIDDVPGLKEYGESQLCNALTVLGLKAAIDKERPDGSGYDSFPSGHTSIAFANATHAAVRYGWNRYTVTSFLIATGVGYTRVASERHDETDVVAGALIGASSAYLFTTHHRTKALSFRYIPHGAILSFRHEF
ncbi:phosphatase PAP2 family protein [Hydrogenimonas sp.]